MKRDINDFVSQKRRSKYYTVNNLSGFLDAQNANKARFLIKFESYMVPIFYLIISSCSMIDLIQLLNLITSPKFLAHYVNCLRLHHQMRSEFYGFHNICFSRHGRCIHQIDHCWTFTMK
jgi:hypothetical protein